MKWVILLLILLVIPIGVKAATHVMNADSLDDDVIWDPSNNYANDNYPADSLVWQGSYYKGYVQRTCKLLGGGEYTDDVIELAGTKVTTPYNTGFWVQDDNVTFNLGDDTLEFSTDTSLDYSFGLYIDLASTESCTVIGGTIIMGGDAVVIDDVTGECMGNNGAKVVAIQGCGALYCYGTRFIAAGVDGSGVAYTGINTVRNVHLEDCTWHSNVIGYYSRSDYHTSEIRLGSEYEGDYTLKMHGCTIENGPHGGMRVGGICYIYDNTIVVDARNDLYAEHIGTGSWSKGSTNSVGISGNNVQAGSQIYNNYILTDSNYSGMDIAILMERWDGTETDTIKIYNNTINVHRGRDAYYGDLNAKGFKNRDWNWYLHIYDNDVTVTADGSALTPWRGPEAHCFDLSCAVYSHSGVTGCDSFLLIENNTFTALDVDGGANQADGVRATALGVNNDTVSCYWDSAGNIWRGNTIISNRQGYRINRQYDGAASNWTVIGDTVIGHDSGLTFYTLRLGRHAGPNINNHFRDVTYQGLAEWDDITYDAFGPAWSAYIDRTFSIYAKGTGIGGDTILPLVGCTVMVWNWYDMTDPFDSSGMTFTGVTDSGGLVYDVVTYHKRANTAGYGDSTHWNPFFIVCKYGGDKVSDSFYVGPTPIEGTDTLSFSNQIGTGEWGAVGSTDPYGSCCDPDGNCTITTDANCSYTWTEDGVCDPNPCDQPTSSDFKINGVVISGTVIKSER